MGAEVTESTRATDDACSIVGCLDAGSLEDGFQAGLALGHGFDLLCNFLDGRE